MRCRIGLLISFLFLIVLNGSIYAQNDSTHNSENESLYNNLHNEIDQLIVNDTQTKIGNDFFDLFYQLWEVPPIITQYTITISEKPLPQLGTLISVTVNDLVVFQQFVQPRYDVLEEKVYQALNTSIQYLINYDEIQRTLQGEDLSGSGIY